MYSDLQVDLINESRASIGTKVGRELDNDEEYEQRKGGFTSKLQKMFRKK